MLSWHNGFCPLKASLDELWRFLFFHLSFFIFLCFTFLSSLFLPAFVVLFSFRDRKGGGRDLSWTGDSQGCIYGSYRFQGSQLQLLYW